MKSWTCLPTTVSFEYRVSRLFLAFSNLAFADRTIVSALSIASWARMFLLKERRDTRLSIWPFACYHLVNRSNSKILFSLAGYAYKLLLDRKHIIWPGKHISIRPKGYLRQTGRIHSRRYDDVGLSPYALKVRVFEDILGQIAFYWQPGHCKRWQLGNWDFEFLTQSCC